MGYIARNCSQMMRCLCVKLSQQSPVKVETGRPNDLYHKHTLVEDDTSTMPLPLRQDSCLYSKHWAPWARLLSLQQALGSLGKTPVSTASTGLLGQDSCLYSKQALGSSCLYSKHWAPWARLEAWGTDRQETASYATFDPAVAPLVYMVRKL